MKLGKRVDSRSFMTFSTKDTIQDYCQAKNISLNFIWNSTGFSNTPFRLLWGSLSFGG
jgi:hypothetical protein